MPGCSCRSRPRCSLTSPGEDTGHASAIYNTIRQSSIALDIAVLTTVVAGAGGGLAAFHDAYLTGAILCAVGCVLAWTLISTDAARSTMSRPSAAQQRGRAAAAETARRLR